MKVAEMVEKMGLLLEQERAHYIKLEEATAKAMIAFEAIVFYKKDKRQWLKRLGNVEDTLLSISKTNNKRGFLASFFGGCLVGFVAGILIYVIIF